jgi:hypothetical protein
VPCPVAAAAAAAAVFLLSVLRAFALVIQSNAMRSVLLTLIMALLAFSAMAGADDDYYPIHAGDEWTSEFKVDPPTEGISEGIFRRRIEGVVNKGGRKYFRSRRWTEGLPSTEFTKLYRKDEKGVYCVEEEIEDPKEQMEVALPLKLGSTWQHKDRQIELTDKVISRETIRAFGKTYESCFHVRSECPSYTADYWLAANVGIVKVHIIYVTGKSLIATLKEFKPGE